MYAGNEEMCASGLQLPGCGRTEVLQHEVRVCEKYDGAYVPVRSSGVLG